MTDEQRKKLWRAGYRLWQFDPTGKTLITPDGHVQTLEQALAELEGKAA